MHRTLALLLTLIALVSTEAGIAQPADSNRVTIQGHLAFSMPPTFEMDGEAGRGGQVMLVPAGTEASKEDGGPFPVASLLINPDIGQPGAYAQLGADITMTDEELEQLDASLQTGFVGEAEQRGDMSDIAWSGTEVVQLERTQAIRFRFTGTIPTGKRIVVNVYMVQNNDTMYYLTLSAHEDVMAEWVPSFNAVLGSLEFAKR